MGRTTKQRGEGRAAGVALGLAAALFAARAAAEPCPQAFIYGPDTVVVAEVQWRLPLAPTSSPEGCSPVTVQVTQDRDGIHLLRQIDGARATRTVSSYDTAASLVASWTTSGADALALVDAPGGPRLVETATASARPPRVRSPLRASKPYTVAARTSRTIPVSEWRSYIAASARSVGGPGMGVGWGFDLAWSRGRGRWRASAIFQGLFDKTSDGLERSGANSFELGAGIRAGYRLGDEILSLYPNAGLALTLRNVAPTQFIGSTTCGSGFDCSDPTVGREHAGAFQAVTAWLDLGGTVEWWPLEAFGVRARGSFGVNPGQAAPDAPRAPSNPSGFRQAPLLPRWRAGAQVGLLWETP